MLQYVGLRSTLAGLAERDCRCHTPPHHAGATEPAAEDSDRDKSGSDQDAEEDALDDDGVAAGKSRTGVQQPAGGDWRNVGAAPPPPSAASALFRIIHECLYSGSQNLWMRRSDGAVAADCGALNCSPLLTASHVRVHRV